ncbi:ATP-dependent RNA helicase glh-2-like [Helianthus annuus]|uniref:ATP-dependent RNA helicase glh-2-like n=1 Tax=Helianthus annuus TaxID=4232 RepID=UPI000B8F987D|nr:ATP-dependent RNA helicase glh-2-like [Helianthus annuus]
MSPSKKHKQHGNRNKGGSKSSIPPCKTCGKLHTGECLLGKKGCYNCGQEGHPYYRCPSPVRTCFNCVTPGHVKAECPKLKQKGQKDGKKDENQKARGRMFQITTEEAKVLPNVVSGIFLVNLIPVNVLFDSGTSRSFVSSELMCHSSFTKERMSIPLEVEVADSKSYLLSEVCRNCKITIENEDFEIDLIPMVLGEYSSSRNGLVIPLSCGNTM